jgi:glycosyltransferase involved in cell wall biosynthesis
MVVYMKVLQVSGTDKVGGAGIASYRLHEGLRQSDIDSQMLVFRKVTSNPTVHRLLPRMSRWGRLQMRVASKRYNHQLKQHPRHAESSYWSLNSRTYPIADRINSFEADIVHIHWVGDNYLPIQQLANINAPIIWTLHDMWAFTGGCHYSGECKAYQTGCGNCPQLIHPQPNDISQQVIQQKIQSWSDIPMTIVCPSQWLADCVRNSQILGNQKVEVIPNGIDTTHFKPIDKTSARHAFNLPQDKKLVLFGAFGGTEDPRKGFTYLRDALKLLPEASDIELVVFGSEQPEQLDVNLPVHQIGRLQDHVSMVLLYSACDVFVLPSLQDNLPNTLIESLACGTPCIAFDTGGISDIIQHQQNGYLAQFKDTGDLAKGIQWTLEQLLQPSIIHQNTVKHYNLPHITEQYSQLYQSLSR